MTRRRARRSATRDGDPVGPRPPTCSPRHRPSQTHAAGRARAPRDPHRERDPVDPDHVRLQADREHGRERRGEPRLAPPQAREHGEAPQDEREHARDARVDAELRVRRLARADLDAGPLRDDARVAEPVPLRVVDDDAHAVAQVAPVALRRGLVAGERIAARVRPAAARSRAATRAPPACSSSTARSTGTRRGRARRRRPTRRRARPARSGAGRARARRDRTRARRAPRACACRAARRRGAARAAPTTSGTAGSTT